VTAQGDPLAVAVVCGLHTDARRTAVQKLLDTVPGSVALHHDMVTAGHGSVLRVVRNSRTVLATGQAPLVNDCACCALREDLVPELLRFADDGSTRLAVVELWDSVEPKAMAEVIATHGRGALRVTSVITAIDPALVLPYLGNSDDLVDAGLAVAASDGRTVADTWARQLEYAPVLALVEGDDTDDTDRALLAQLHPTARQIDVSEGQELAGAALSGFDVEEAAARQHPACALLPQEAEAAGVGTLVWHRTRPCHSGRLYAALEELCTAAARSRGRFWLADRPDTLLSWDAAGGALCVDSHGPWLAGMSDEDWDAEPATRTAAAALDWHPEHGDRCQHLVFTSPGLDMEGVEQLLDSCLLTDAEYAAGRAAWKLLPRDFDAFLEV
jgi:G3E family GTPase